MTKPNGFVILSTIFAGFLSGRVLMHLIDWKARIRAGFINTGTIRKKHKHKEMLFTAEKCWKGSSGFFGDLWIGGPLSFY